MIHLLEKLRTSFDKALDQWLAEAIGEPQSARVPPISSAMIISQTDTTATVYTAGHITVFAGYMPALIELLKDAPFDDAGHLLEYAKPLHDAANILIIAENPPGNYRLDKKMLVALRELAETLLPYQDKVCSLSGIIDAAQMLCQTYHIERENSSVALPSNREYLPKGYN